jgi:protein gp37
MGDKSDIQWTDATWNPVTGCTEVSPGCDHCYAKTFAERFRGVPNHPYTQGFDLTLHPDRLDLPLRWTKPRRIFVNSMSDLFHQDVPDRFIEQVFDVMGDAQQHTFQVLTKRPDRMRRYCLVAGECEWPYPYPNVWLGTSVESAAYTWRIDKLRETPAAVRFLSCEPLLGPINLQRLRITPTHHTVIDGLAGYGLETGGRTKLDWVIAGGESGPDARPMHPDWARGLRDQCQATGVPFFFKQWGEWAPQIGAIDLYEFGEQSRRQWAVWEDDRWEHWDRPCWMDDLGPEEDCMVRVGKHRAGALLDGREHREMPNG